jgi:NTP pyrophosphatase (non-canonical NTP hydrolase)
MNIKLYQKAAQRTIKPLGSEVLDITHMALGMASELGELMEVLEVENPEDVDKIHLGEEIGDKMWYAANYATIRGFELDNDVYFVASRALAIVINGGKIADFAKRWLAYGQPLDQQKEAPNEKTILLEYISDLNKLAASFGLDIEEIMARNITKLYVRYPDKFSDDAALVRDLEAERLALEGK